MWHGVCLVMRRKCLPHKDLGVGGRAFSVVSPYTARVYVHRHWGDVQMYTSPTFLHIKRVANLKRQNIAAYAWLQRQRDLLQCPLQKVYHLLDTTQNSFDIQNTIQTH